MNVILMYLYIDIQLNRNVEKMYIYRGVRAFKFQASVVHLLAIQFKCSKHKLIKVEKTWKVGCRKWP